MSKTILNNKNLVEIIDNPNSTVYKIKSHKTFSISKEHAEAYLKDAHKILDNLSGKFNPIGIDGIIGALIYAIHAEDYYGDKNK